MKLILPNGEVQEFDDTSTVIIDNSVDRKVTIVKDGDVKHHQRFALLEKLRNHAVNLKELVL